MRVVLLISVAVCRSMTLHARNKYFTISWETRRLRIKIFSTVIDRQRKDSDHYNSHFNNLGKIT